MGRTVIEKILAAHSTEEVAAGRIVWVDLDLRTARDFGGANVVKHFEREYPGESVADPAKTFFTFDCNVPANTIAYARNQQTCREFARNQGIRVYDVDMGIGSHVMMDEGLCLPASTVVGTDSHLNILGAVGAFGQGMGDQDIAFAFRTGRTWFEVPPTIKVEITGRYDLPTTAKDVTLAVLRELGSRGALGRAVEFTGDAVEALSLDGRITLASMVTEMGGIVGLIRPDARVQEYLAARAKGSSIAPTDPDPDAGYEQVIRIDVSGLEPLLAAPPSPSNVLPVADVGDVRVDSVFIGSCTNGRPEDLAVAAEILKGKRVAEGVMLRIVPATREIFGRMLADGSMKIFYDAGAVVSNPGCGGCAEGQIGMTGDGEVQVSTSNRNFPGKQGAGMTYISSPATAAASAIAGKIVPA